MTTYVFARETGFALRGDPQAIGERLQEIAERNEGMLRTEDVLEDAMHPDSPIHPNITTNTDEAAHKWRMHECRHVIKGVRTLRGKEEEPIRSFWNVSTSAGRYYSPVKTVLSSDDLRNHVIDQLAGKIRSLGKQQTMLREADKEFVEEVTEEAADKLTEYAGNLVPA